jgi:reverse gyrase
MKTIIAFLLLASCTNPIQDEIILDDVDSILMHSKSNIDTIQNFLPSVDKTIEVAEKKVLVNIQTIKAQNERLKENAKIVKTITIRDTIIIKEKTNFWGRKKTSTDSINVIDSTEHQ